MTDDASPPLTRAELDVVEARANGWDCPRIAAWLGISVHTVRTHIGHAAEKIPNPDALDPMDIVFLWGAHRVWLKRHGILNIDDAA